MQTRWPPHPLGLGTPLNLAAAAPRSRGLLCRSWWLAPVLGTGTPLVMLAIDRAFFAGASLERVRALGSETLWFRLLAALYSGVTEELVYRLGLATLVAWLAHLALRGYARHARTAAQWLGVLVAAVLFGLAHVGNIPDAANPVLRAVAVNGPAGVVFGWLYWSRGLELAVLTHMLAIAVLYIAVPLFL